MMRYSALRDVDQLILQKFKSLTAALIVFNLAISIFVISKVPYTEIDWKAYMEEVGGVVNDRQFDYTYLKGETGPLVYPAGFVYIFSLLSYITDSGQNVRLAQYIFACLHAVLLLFVILIYRSCYQDRLKDSSFPLWIIIFLIVSRRVSSLFVLRLFNDGVQMLFLYASIVLFLNNKWSVGSFVYSVSVSIKMNALLFAPGLALLLCQARGLGGAVRQILGICATTQLLLGAPFLIHAPTSYLSRAFEFSRVFLHKWSVNGAVLSEDTFLDKRVALLLLSLHLFVLLRFGQSKWTASGTNGLSGLLVTNMGGPGQWLSNLRRERTSADLRATHIARVLFTSNLIGVAFARSLHYQFYLWYAHSLPLLVCFADLHSVIKVSIVAVIEIVFNIYPPHPLAACTLHAAHATLLYSLWRRPQATRSTIFKMSSVPSTAKGDLHKIE